MAFNEIQMRIEDRSKEMKRAWTGIAACAGLAACNPTYDKDYGPSGKWIKNPTNGRKYLSLRYDEYNSLQPGVVRKAILAGPQKRPNLPSRRLAVWTRFSSCKDFKREGEHYVKAANKNGRAGLSDPNRWRSGYGLSDMMFNVTIFTFPSESLDLKVFDAAHGKCQSLFDETALMKRGPPIFVVFIDIAESRSKQFYYDQTLTHVEFSGRFSDVPAALGEQWVSGMTNPLN